MPPTAFLRPKCSLCYGTGFYAKFRCGRCGGTGVPQRPAAPRLLAALESCRTPADIEAALLKFSQQAALHVTNPYLAGRDDGEVAAAAAVWLILSNLPQQESVKIAA